MPMPYHYAVNVADLTKPGAKVIATFMIAPVTPNRYTVTAEPGRLDGGAVVLECDDEHAQAIVEIIRRTWSRNALRCYHSQTGKTWKRV